MPNERRMGVVISREAAGPELAEDLEILTAATADAWSELVDRVDLEGATATLLALVQAAAHANGVLVHFVGHMEIASTDGCGCPVCGRRVH